MVLIKVETTNLFIMRVDGLLKVFMLLGKRIDTTSVADVKHRLDKK